jgi:hypothetical protein
MKTYLKGSFAAAMILVWTTTWSAETSQKNGPHNSPNTTPETEGSQPVADQTPVAKQTRQHKNRTSNTPRPRDLDFRHCLELEDNAAISKCAQEQ